MNFFTFLAESFRARTTLFGALVIGMALPAVARSQTANDSAAYARAREMVSNGDAVKGRRVADSVAAAAPAGSGAFAEGLFWRAMLAENAKDSERYYRQIIVDYPLSGRVSDALLRIGQLESARGDNAAALQHFQRLVLEHPDSRLRPEASYWVAQMYFKANDASRACTANADALANVKQGNVELKNRIDFQQQRCRGVALASTAPSAKPSAPVSVPVDRSPPAESARQVTTKKAEVKAEVKAEAKAESLATRAQARAQARARDSIATERALERVRAESISIAKTAEARALASAKARADAKADAGARAAKAASSSSSRPDTSAQPSSVLSGHPGAVTRQPTREEVARALASADMPVGKKVASQMATKTAAKSTARTATTRTATRAASASKASTGSGMFAVQIAAFGTKQAANVLVAKMRGRGYDAYVDGGEAPYRVRVGHYSSHALATAALEKLKAKHIDGFVAER
ncbi:MAG: SPOR domain-containing protein [Gemmatimonadota bacterium]|nr:SPOR domain-containing protein [Gemmatimonadota bacterium]